MVSGACGRSAVDLYDNMYRLTELKVRKWYMKGLGTALTLNPSAFEI